LKDEVDRVALGLMRLGVRKGEKIGIWSTNCFAWVMVQFATAKIGAVLVNVNPAYRRHEVEFALRQSECAYLLIGEGFKDVRYAEVVEAVRAALAGLKMVVTLPGAAGGAGMMTWEEMVALQKDEGGRMKDETEGLA
jgi:fatty-acyl-CoA synthase